MSTLFEAWNELSTEGTKACEGAIDEQETSIVGQFANEQLLALVQRLFLAGWPRSMRQVVFAGTSEDAGSAGICRLVAETLAEQSRARICLLETDPRIEEAEMNLEDEREQGGKTEGRRIEATGAIHLRRNLQLLPASVWKGPQGSLTLPWIRRRLGELRSDFEYAVIHAAPLGVCSETETLARLTDGIVLVVEAHRTRRVQARMMQQKLRATGVQVLGAILSGRTFPIPERIYRRF